MSHKLLSAALAGILMMTAGCSFIPEYQQPKLSVEDTWTGAAGQTDARALKNANDKKVQTLPFAADLAWQSYFRSDTLCQLIRLALDNNRDLRVAILTIEKARASYRIQTADALPVVSGNAGVSRQGVPEDSSATGRAYTGDTAMTANLGISAYELDFFGRVSSLNQKALETFLATEEAALSTRIALIGQTADAYVTLLANRKLMALAQSTFQAQKETYDVIKNQVEVGSAPQLDLAQAATAVENARVSISQYARQLARSENSLTLLAGTPVNTLINTSESINDLQFINTLPPGLPSQVLLARPDIRAAEHQLKAANADIGAARAALYPSIRLTGSLGFASQSLTSLFDVSDSLAWNFSPSLTIPIFNRQALNAGLEASKINEEIAVASYEKTVQAAFREVADQLDARKTYQNQLNAQKALVTATQEAYTLSRARYENGVDDFLSVLDSQRALFSAQQGTITVSQALLSNQINLYKVMGGGQI